MHPQLNNQESTTRDLAEYHKIINTFVHKS